MHNNAILGYGTCGKLHMTFGSIPYKCCKMYIYRIAQPNDEPSSKRAVDRFQQLLNLEQTEVTGRSDWTLEEQDKQGSVPTIRCLTPPEDGCVEGRALCYGNALPYPTLPDTDLLLPPGNCLKQ